jgi:hypothetical protein
MYWLGPRLHCLLLWKGGRNLKNMLIARSFAFASFLLFNRDRLSKEVQQNMATQGIAERKVPRRIADNFVPLRHSEVPCPFRDQGIRHFRVELEAKSRLQPVSLVSHLPAREEETTGIHRSQMSHYASETPKTNPEKEHMPR